MKLTEAIAKRRSVRTFSNRPVNFGMVLEAIDAGNQAPLAGNINNLKYLIIENLENKKLIAEFSQQTWISDASWVVLVCTQPDKLESQYQDRGLVYNRQQVGAVIENMLLSLTDQGLGACWVGAFAESEIKSYFKIPEDWNLEAAIPIGYPKTKVKQSERKSNLDSRIYWEKWTQLKKPLKYPHQDPLTSGN